MAGALEQKRDGGADCAVVVDKQNAGHAFAISAESSLLRTLNCSNLFAHNLRVGIEPY
jgi:hypothetical protein